MAECVIKSYSSQCRIRKSIYKFFKFYVVYGLILDSAYSKFRHYFKLNKMSISIDRETLA